MVEGQGVGFRVYVGFRVQLGFRVEEVGFRVEEGGFRVYGLVSRKGRRVPLTSRIKSLRLICTNIVTAGLSPPMTAKSTAGLSSAPYSRYDFDALNQP